MKRTAVLKKLAKAAKAHQLDFATSEGTRHTEVDDVTAHKFFDQFAGEFGKGWWR